MNVNWISPTGGLWSVGENWSGGLVPSTNDVAVFSTIYGSGDITIDQNVVCSGITVSGNYNGNMTSAGYGYYLTGNYIDDGTGSRNLGSGMIFNGVNTTGHFGSTLGTVSAGYCNICACTNDITIDDDKGITFNSLRVESGVTVTNNGSTNSTYSSNAGTSPLVFTNGGQLKILRQMSFNKGSEAGALIDVQAGSPVISGSADIFLAANFANASFFIPALNIYGTTALRVSSSMSNVIINQSGDFNVRDFYLRPVTGSVNWTFNTNNHNITCQKLTFGGATATHTLSGFLGSSNISCTSYDGSTNNIGTNKLYMQSSNIICSGSWAHGSNHTIDPGTSVVNILNTSTVTSNNKAFYDLTINTASGLIATFADPLICSGDFTVTEGATTFNGTTGTFYGDAIIDGTSTHNLGNGITCNGASSTFHIGSTVDTITASSCVLTMNGTTGMTIDIDKIIGNYNSTGFFKFVLGANAVVTISGAAHFTAGTTDGTPSLVLGDNSILNANRPFLIYARSAQTVASFGVGSILRGSANIGFHNYGNTYITFTIPAITYTGTGSITLNFAGFSNNVNSKMIIAGDINTGNAELNIYDSWGYLLPTITINDGVTITCGTFTYGRSIMYFGASIINCTSAVPALPNETTIYLQTSTWNCSGNFSLPTTNPIDPGTSIVNILNTSTITSNSKAFYDLTINTASGLIATFADPLICSGDFTVTEGATTFNGTTGTFYGDAIIDGTSTHNLGNGITCNGASSTFHIGSTVDTITASSCVLTMNGTTGMTLDIDKAMNLLQLVLGANAVVVNSGAATCAFTGSPNEPLIFAAGATFTNNCSITFGGAKGLAKPFMSFAGAYTFNGSYPVSFWSRGSMTLPAFTYTGTGIINLVVNSTSSLVVTGNQSYGGGCALSAYVSDAATATIDFNDFNLTATTLSVTKGNVAQNFTYNFGNGTFNIAAFAGGAVAGTSNVNLESAVINCSGSWTFGSNHIVDPGTSTVNITNTSTITSASKSFYNLNLSAPGKIITIADDINLAIGGGFALTAGTVSAGTTYCIFAGNGSITLGADLSWRLRTAINSSTITWDTGTNIWTIPAYTLNDWGGTTSTVSWISSSPGSQYKISAPAGIAVNYMNVTDCNNIGIDIDALAVTNVNGGNNLGWLFLGAGGLNYHTRHTDFIINLLTRM